LGLYEQIQSIIHNFHHEAPNGSWILGVLQPPLPQQCGPLVSKGICQLIVDPLPQFEPSIIQGSCAIVGNGVIKVEFVPEYRKSDYAVPVVGGTIGQTSHSILYVSGAAHWSLSDGVIINVCGDDEITIAPIPIFNKYFPYLSLVIYHVEPRPVTLTRVRLRPTFTAIVRRVVRCGFPAVVRGKERGPQEEKE
jgi:hypothetical protein